MKDNQASRKFTVCAENVKELQNCTTWADADDEKPKFQPIMMIIDEMVDNPRNAKGQYFRSDNKSKRKARVSFLVPDDFDQAKFPALLKSVADEMKTSANQSKSWFCTTEVIDFFRSVYGSKKFNTQGNNRQKKR